MYSERDLKRVRAAGLKHRDKSSNYLQFSKSLRFPTIVMVITAVIYSILTGYYGNEFLMGLWAFGGLASLGVALQIIFLILSDKYATKYHIAENYVLLHKFDYKHIDNSHNKEI